MDGAGWIVWFINDAIYSLVVWLTRILPHILNQSLWLLSEYIHSRQSTMSANMRFFQRGRCHRFLIPTRVTRFTNDKILYYQMELQSVVGHLWLVQPPLAYRQHPLHVVKCSGLITNTPRTVAGVCFQSPCESCINTAYKSLFPYIASYFKCINMSMGPTVRGRGAQFFGALLLLQRRPSNPPSCYPLRFQQIPLNR